MFDIYEVVFEIYNGDRLVGKQTMQAPKEMLMIHFIQTVNQFVEKDKDQIPLKVRMYRPEIIWDNFECKQKVINNEIEFSNNAMIAWEENHKSEVKE